MPGKIKLSAEEINFYRPLIALYLKTGSVDRVFATLYQNPGVSYPHFHRILQKWGIVKSAGPTSHLAEAVYFLSAMAKKNMPLETVYKTMPPTLKISAATLHRILHCIKNGLIRRYATGLVITSAEDQNQVLIGRDIATPRNEIGKPYGALSLPMTFSRPTESFRTSILRVLQQEVMTNLALSNQIPENIMPLFPSPLMIITVADVRVNIFHLSFPSDFHFSSEKLVGLQYMPADKIVAGDTFNSNFRAGIPEIIKAYLETNENTTDLPLFLESELNQRLALATSV